MNGHSGEQQDQVLGRALRELEVPEHRPGFYGAVRAKLEEEAAGRGVLGRESNRFPVRPLERGRPPTRRRWVWGWATAAAITALSLVAVMVGVLGPSPRVATAAEVRARVARAWASAESISGELVVNNRGVFGSGERRWAFILTARGDFRLTDLTRGGDLVYSAGRGEERSLSVSESIQDSDQPFAYERRGLAPGLPDQGPSLDILDRNLGSVVRALAAGGGGSVREVSYRGRPAWLLDTEIRANLLEPELSPNHLQVTVDQETGLPMRVVASHDGRLVYETRLEGLRVDPPLPENAFRLDFPPGAEVFRSDEGFRRVRLDQVEARVGYSALAPTSVPEGYRLTEVAVSRKPSVTGAEAGNPSVGNIVSLSYRRGLDQFIVTTRPIGGDPSAWGDLLATGEGYVDKPKQVTFSDGALRGRAGELLIDPLAIPHVWAMTDRLVVTVSGDLTGAELLRVAESLE
jgi:hypothetical protein